MKPAFDKAQNTATKLLLQQDITSLHIDVRSLTLPDHIHIDSMQNFCALTGLPISELLREGSVIEGACVFRQYGHQIILYDDNIANEHRKHWGIAHELGHVLLDHRNDDRTAEIEAHFFAAQLIAPEIVLWELCRRKGRLSDSDLSTHFNLSFEAAVKRITTLSRRNTFNCTDIDKQLLRKFAPAIDRAMPRFLAS